MLDRERLINKVTSIYGRILGRISVFLEVVNTEGTSLVGDAKVKGLLKEVTSISTFREGAITRINENFI